MEPSKMIRRTKDMLNASVCEQRETGRRNLADISYQSSSRTRSTMHPSEFLLPHNLTKTRTVERISIRTPQVDKSFDDEDTEMKLLYDKYLQSLMAEIIFKQKMQMKEKLAVSQLASLAKELDHNKQKLFELQTRERDIIHLNALQNEIDLQTEDVKKYIKSDYIQKIENILSQLHIVLKDCDVLRCDNVILPETPSEWEETIQALKSCCDTLKSIMVIIGPHIDAYLSVNEDVKDFLNTYNTIEDHHKRLEKEVNQLQALALKTVALSLM
ncbi:uncharacterized protein LOC117228576 [Megalopta genalis]|uniref:uncharacterized protein LOC117228576 n=1 Tax=Megalopta genalis TaxID=115081 RepID=UPI0014430525|nr:uncharacterized protein LOC117228576 [Megalopta genalis]